MKKRAKEHSIKFSMVESIILYVLMPLFLALVILCFFLQRTMVQDTSEAYQMMFDQKVSEIDQAVLQSNYASSIMITYTENSELLKSYYEKEKAYEKDQVSGLIKSMILNMEIITLGSFKGEMMLLMNDERLISSSRAFDAPAGITERPWYAGMQDNGQRPYWDEDISRMFENGNSRNYVAFGRALSRYQETSLAYALVRIPRQIFSWSDIDTRFRQGGGGLVMLAEDGRLLFGDDSGVPEEAVSRLYENWQENGVRTGRLEEYYYMASRLTNGRNSVMYIGRVQDIFRRSREILTYVLFFVAGITVLLICLILSIAGHITRPILFLADRVQYIGQDRPDWLRLEENHFLETRTLEEGMLRAQKQIHSLMEDVRAEAFMKENARFEALKAQINPHFLFNTLNAIRWKASINQDTEVADILSELGLLLGETYKNNEELESIDNAVRILDAYVKIMEIRFGSQVQFFLMIPDEIREYQIPRFCLQPLVENSFIHGMAHQEEGIIALRGEREDGDIILTLIDNGEGSQGSVPDLQEDEAKHKGITGIGLSNIHKRIRALFGEDYGLEIDTEVQVGFKVSLRIPARKEKGENEGVDRGR